MTVDESNRTLDELEPDVPFMDRFEFIQQGVVAGGSGLTTFNACQAFRVSGDGFGRCLGLTVSGLGEVCFRV